MSTTQNSNLYSANAGTTSSAIFATNPVIQERDPATTDTRGSQGEYPVGKLWINKTVGTVFALAAFSASAGSITANWVSLQGAASGVDELDADSGTATPSSGTITIAGSANQVDTSATGSVVTLAVPTDFRVSGTITAMSGNITADNGNIVRGSEGNKDIYGVVASSTTAGNASAGTCNLTSGVATVTTTALQGASLIRVCRQTTGTSASNPIGELSTLNLNPGVSFQIVSIDPANAANTVTTDNSSVFWEIVN